MILLKSLNIPLSFQWTPASSVDNIVTEDESGLKDDGVDKKTGVDSDFFSQTIRLTN